MAIYSFNAKMISRANGQNVVASAAYRSGEKLKDYATGETKRYKAREVAPENIILAPSYAPGWVQNREQLWNAVEASEKRVNSQLARSFMVALPVEFSRDEQREIVMKFAQEHFVDKGMIADIAIHRDDQGNPHAHILTTTRHIDSEKGFTTKERSWNDRELMNEWREGWEKVCNEKLVEIGYEDRLISHKSYEARGLNYIATVHLGHKENALRLKGIMTERAILNETIKQHNAQLKQLEKEMKQASKEELYAKMEQRTHILASIKIMRTNSSVKTFVNQNIYSKTFKDEYKDLTRAYYIYSVKQHAAKNMDANLFYKHLLDSRQSTINKKQAIEERMNKTLEKRESYVQFLERQRGMIQRGWIKVNRLNALEKKISEYEKKFFGLGVILYSKNIQKALIERQGILKSYDIQNYIKFTNKHGIYTESALDKALQDTRKSILEYKRHQESTLAKMQQTINDKAKQIAQFVQLSKEVADFSKEMEHKEGLLEQLKATQAKALEQVEQLNKQEKVVNKALEQAPKEVVQVPSFDQATQSIVEKHERLKEIAPFVANSQTFAKLATRYDEISVANKHLQSVFVTFQKQIKINNLSVENHYKEIEMQGLKIASAKQNKESLEKELIKRQEHVERLEVINTELNKNEGVSGKLKAFASKGFKQKQISLQVEKETLENMLKRRTVSVIREELKAVEQQIGKHKQRLHDLKTSDKPKQLEKDNEQLQEFSKIVEPFNEQQRSITKEIQRSIDFERGR